LTDTNSHTVLVYVGLSKVFRYNGSDTIRPCYGENYITRRKLRPLEKHIVSMSVNTGVFF